ncbi:MAG TPA: MmcQ/YjbR family DNA-binding protein [Kofleriaceae bacterium]|nr:MmcQ/YjbR family DNA-binding protein [Kofleriaceae bacterium]
MAKKKALATDKVLQELRAFGMQYPGAHFKSPWPGHMDLAVNDKTFAYLSNEGEPFGISCKLPQSAAVALMLPFCSPAAYGLGKAGWVSAKFPEGKALPVEMLKEWLDESYRAQAPKKFLKQLEGGAAAPATVNKRKPVTKRTAAAKTTKRAAKKRVS